MQVSEPTFSTDPVPGLLSSVTNVAVGVNVGVRQAALSMIARSDICLSRRWARIAVTTTLKSGILASP
jgi:hypothetical protein